MRGVLDYYARNPGSLLVVHDEIDLPPGTVRLKKGGGHGGHNGIRDVIQHCGRDFMRLRVGVGHPGEKDKVTGHVLRRAGPISIQSCSAASTKRPTSFRSLSTTASTKP